MDRRRGRGDTPKENGHRKAISLCDQPDGRGGQVEEVRPDEPGNVGVAFALTGLSKAPPETFQCLLQKLHLGLREASDLLCHWRHLLVVMYRSLKTNKTTCDGRVCVRVRAHVCVQKWPRRGRCDGKQFSRCDHGRGGLRVASTPLPRRTHDPPEPVHLLLLRRFS